MREVTRLEQKEVTEVPVRQRVLDQIRRIAAEQGGTPPGKYLFNRMTGFSHSLWQGQIWLKWSDAVREAGFVPNLRTPRLQDQELLADYAAAIRATGRVPTHAELVVYRKSGGRLAGHHTYQNHFGGKPALLRAVKRWAEADPGWEDVAAILGDSGVKEPAIAKDGGAVYLLKSGFFYKIGCSRTPEQRTQVIARALPAKAKLLHVIETDDPHGVEAYWHRRFANKRKGGEWFHLSHEEVAAFRARRFQ